MAGALLKLSPGEPHIGVGYSKLSAGSIDRNSAHVLNLLEQISSVVQYKTMKNEVNNKTHIEIINAIENLDAITGRKELHDSLRAIINEALINEPTVYSISAQEFENRKTREAVLNDRAVWALAWQADQLIGMGQIQVRSIERIRHKAEIAKIYVSPRFRGQGVGRDIVRTLQSSVPPDIEFLRLYVNATQKASINLYRSEGFHVYALESFAKKVDGVYVDEYVMQKDLRKINE